MENDWIHVLSLVKFDSPYEHSKHPTNYILTIANDINDIIVYVHIKWCGILISISKNMEKQYMQPIPLFCDRTLFSGIIIRISDLMVVI